MDESFYKSIVKYLELGWSAFPVEIETSWDGDKIKKIPKFPRDNGIQSWKGYQLSRLSKEDIEFEWVGFSHVGIVTGKISGITVIDLDSKDKKLVPPEFFETYTVETRNGYHFYFKYFPEAKQTQNEVSRIDIRNDGGFVFAPPTKYELPDRTSVSYKIINAKKPLDFPIEWYKKTFNQLKNNWKEKIVSPIQLGSRNMDFTSIVGGLLNRFPQDDWEKVVWPIVKDKNSLQERPLSENELRTVFFSISKKELERRNKGGIIKDILSEVLEDETRISIVLERNIVCFKAKNIISNLLEATVITWIKKPSGLTHEIPFYLKIKSDSNKESWVRILSKAFDNKEEKEVYPWTILVAKVNAEIEKKIKEHKQDFLLSEIVPKDITWVHEPFIQEDQINTFFGLGSSGKTILSLYFSTVVKNTKTLFIDYENDSSSWADKMNKLLALGADKDNFVYFDSEQISISEQVDKIKETIKKHGIKLVIIDSASLSTGDSTSDEKSVLRLISGIKLLKITTILIAHQRKNDGDRTPIGSIQFENQARNVWNFKSTPDETDISTLHIACKHTKANNTYLRKDPIGFKIVFGNSSIEISHENAIDNFEEKFSVIERIRNLLLNEGEMTSKEISDSLNVSAPSIKKNLTIGKNRGYFQNNKEKWSLLNNKQVQSQW